MSIAGLIEHRFGKHYHPASLSKLLKRMELARQKPRPVHPKTGPKAQADRVKRSCPAH